jgi:hypothetical protein
MEVLGSKPYICSPLTQCFNFIFFLHYVPFITWRYLPNNQYENKIHVCEVKIWLLIMCIKCKYIYVSCSHWLLDKYTQIIWGSVNLTLIVLFHEVDVGVVLIIILGYKPIVFLHMNWCWWLFRYTNIILSLFLLKCLL